MSVLTRDEQIKANVAAAGYAIGRTAGLALLVLALLAACVFLLML